MIYIVVFLYILISALVFEGKKSDMVSKTNWIIVFSVFVLLFGLRYRIGGDSIQCEDNFLQYGESALRYDLHFTILDRHQPLWVIMCSYINMLGGQFVVLQLIESFAINYAIFFFISKYSNHKYYVLVLYYVLWYQYYTTEILRESFAVAVFLLSFNYFINKNWLKYYLFVFIAIMFHSSALILLVFPLLLRISENVNFYKLIVVIISLMAFILAVDFSTLFQADINSYEYRLMNSYYFTGKQNFYGILESSLFRLLPYIVTFIIFTRSGLKKEKDFFIIFSICVFAVVAVVLPQSSRYMNYLHIPYIVLLVDLMFEKVIVWKKYNVYLYIVLVVLTYNRVNWYFHDYSNLTGCKGDRYYNLFIPYNSVLKPQKDTERERVAFFNHEYLGQ